MNLFWNIMIWCCFYLILMRNFILKSLLKNKDLWLNTQNLKAWIFGSNSPFWMNSKCCSVLVYCWKTQVSVHGKQLMSFMFWWQIFRTLPDATLPEPVTLSASPPNAPPRQSKRQGQRTKRPVAVYNLCIELEDGKMLITCFFLIVCWEYGKAYDPRAGHCFPSFGF